MQMDESDSDEENELVDFIDMEENELISSNNDDLLALNLKYKAKLKEYYGRGNAKSGYRKPYHMHFDSAQHFLKRASRVDEWDSYIPLPLADFKLLCAEIYPEWMLPRYGNQIRPRKHSVQACLFSVLGQLCTGTTCLNMQAVIDIDDALIDIEFARVLCILDRVLDDQMRVMTAAEKAQCVGACEAEPDIMYYLDGMDCALEISEHKWIYKTHKDNNKKKTAFRCQVLIDSLYV